MPLLKTGIENWLLEDEHLEADMAEERQVMDSLYNWLLSEKHPVQNWFYGHFQGSHVEYISDIRFEMLNIRELYELNTGRTTQALE